MPNILSIDTTGDFGSIALLRDNAMVEVPLHSTDGFAHVLFEQIEQLLCRCGVQLSDVDCFASAAGPGSFTGVRVGLTAAKGLAEATGKPLVTVSNLRAIASFGSAALRSAIMDARRGEIYAGLYMASGQLVGEERVLAFPQWLALLPQAEVEFVATDITPFAAALAGTRFKNITPAPRALAGAIARLAAGEFDQGRLADPAAADANYVRRSDAELKWTD
jgi:tRNA threonylcarbamoyladenosine biosynthesis protein TsaB